MDFLIITIAVILLFFPPHAIHLPPPPIKKMQIIKKARVEFSRLNSIRVESIACHFLIFVNLSTISIALLKFPIWGKIHNIAIIDIINSSHRLRLYGNYGKINSTRHSPSNLTSKSLKPVNFGHKFQFPNSPPKKKKQLNFC